MSNNLGDLDGLFSKLLSFQYPSSHRIGLACHAFDCFDKMVLVGGTDESLQGYYNSLFEYAEHIDDNNIQFHLDDCPSVNVGAVEEVEELGERTGRVYSQMWRQFDESVYFDEARELLRQRVDRNDLRSILRGDLLDAGCGSGRYTHAFSQFRLDSLTGLDVSQDAIDFAKGMSKNQPEPPLFLRGSVLNMPFEDEYFDVVFSNGVLHHTESTEVGLAEIQRVLRPGGHCWIYLYGGPGSLFWRMIDFCRRILQDVGQVEAMASMFRRGYSSGRVFHRCDFFYAPVHRRYDTSVAEKMFSDAGLSVERRLKRGCAHDWDEIIYNSPNFSSSIYGGGEIRYLLRKA